MKRSEGGKYQLEQCIGQGAQSVVYKAREIGTENFFALKQIMCPETGLVCPLTSLGANFREVSTLNQLMDINCENIVRLVDIVNGNDRLSLVFEYCDENLSDWIKRRRKLKPIPISVVRDLSHQLITGMAIVHGCRIIHRDVKPQNILVKKEGSSGLVLKIADFGLAKQFSYPPALETLEVASLWYKAPEVLLRSGYDVGMDLWGIGCVVGEIVLGEPVFREDSEIGMLMKIFQTLGTPGVDEWPSLRYASNASMKWPKWNRTRSVLEFKNRICSVVGTSGFDLIIGFLTFNPNKRIRCKVALNHDFFENSENRV